MELGAGVPVFPQCTLYTSHLPLYTTRFTLYTYQLTPITANVELHNVQFTLQTSHWTLQMKSTLQFSQARAKEQVWSGTLTAGDFLYTESQYCKFSVHCKHARYLLLNFLCVYTHTNIYQYIDILDHTTLLSIPIYCPTIDYSEFLPHTQQCLKLHY